MSIFYASPLNSTGDQNITDSMVTVLFQISMFFWFWWSDHTSLAIQELDSTHTTLKFHYCTFNTHINSFRN